MGCNAQSTQRRIVLICIVSLFLSTQSLASTKRYVTPELVAPAVTVDSGHHVESAQTVPPLAWHSKIHLQAFYSVGLANQAAQLRADIIAGLGLPGRLELNVGIPIGVTLGSMRPSPSTNEPHPASQARYDGAGFGDLRSTLLFAAKEAPKGGLAILLGVHLYAPTGDNQRLLGTGTVGGMPFTAWSISIFSARLTMNLGYQFRSRQLSAGADTYQQDDSIIWRAALRVPRDEDISWSVESQGAIGVATDEGFWPGSAARPVWLGGGLDYPLDRARRIGFVCGFGVAGRTVPVFNAGMRITGNTRFYDEDNDGVPDHRDSCQLLREDRDGYLDDDGCPDPDNDGDSVPDTEDACPMQPGDEFSDDGC